MPIASSMQHGDGIPTHKVAYLYLHEMGNNFITGGGNLPLSEKPTGTYSWVPPSSVHLEASTSNQIVLDIDQYLDEMESVYISSEVDPEELLDDTNSGNERESGILVI